MKDFFEIVLILFITLSMFICMMFFSEEVSVQQEAIHLRNRVIEIIEIENGYTNNAKDEINSLISNSKRQIIVNVNKSGKLNYGDKVIIEVSIYYNRRLPFNIEGKLVKYSIMGEYYNINS
ncbi:MAG: hypothetical protein E7166_06860 [Firmicutes bacterium]|nr:hypothetical protein [Bacillota bacterium]